jgi:cell division protein FtsN
MILPLAAIASGTLILIAIVIAIIVAVAFGYYTYTGSAIDAHPNDGLDGAPGAAEPSQASGRGRTGDDDDDPFSDGGSLSSHGTR